MGSERGLSPERLTAEDFEGGGQEGAKVPRGKWESEAWRRPMQQSLVRACLWKVGSEGRWVGREKEGRTYLIGSGPDHRSSVSST